MKTKHCKSSKKTHVVTSFAEAILLERNNTSPSFWQVGLKLAISSYVLFANALLYFMKKCWFSSITEVNDVVIYTVGTLGDNVLMLPAVAAVRAKYPAAKLSVVTNCDGFGAYAARQVWEKSELVDYFISLSNHPVKRHKYTFKLNNDDFEQKKCDLFINLSPFGNRGWLGALIREMIFARFLGAKQAIGFSLSSYNRKGLFNRVQHLFVTNEARRPRAVLKELNIYPLEDVDLLVHDSVAKKHVEHVLLGAGIELGKGLLILLNPGSKLAASRWPAQRFGEFAAWLSKTYDAQVVVNGVESENMICDEVVRTSGGKAISFSGQLSIQELIELVRLCDACVSNNTGTMTLAAMVKTPMIVISSTRFSPTFYMPISKKMIWLFSFCEASYSYNDIGMTSEDMLNIEVKDVALAYQKLIEIN
ncbi:MAG: glycosyltransferase family 9 protein [Legionellaceae bacterium]|nr:glycosyltransferase family 9 protein [Legionellaceae bacterium]